MREKLMELKEQLCEEMLKLGERGINSGNLEAIYFMAVAAEKIMKMQVLEGEMEGGYSQRGYSREGGYSGEYSQRRGYSREGGGYSGEGGYSEKRDRYGRYSRDSGASYESGESYGRGGRGGYSRDDGMEHMKREMQRMMEEASSPEEKRAIERCIRQLDG